MEMMEAIYSLMKLTSKLVEAIPQNNDDFLWELLELSLSSIVEADYGSISIVDETNWRFAAVKGHDWELISQLPLKAEYSLQLEAPDKSISSNVYVVENILSQNSVMPPEIQKQLIEASLPIKQSLIAQIRFDGKCKGYICLDLAEGSIKSFESSSKEILKAIGDLASSYLMMRETYFIMGGLEQIVESRTQAVRILLDNIGQGLLTFGSDLIVHRDYSYECQRIFGTGIENKVFSQLIYNDNKEETQLVENIMLEIFKCKESYRAEVYMTLLPQEVELNNKYIRLEYKLVANIYAPLEKALMVIITEITEKRLLENKVKEDAEIMRMVANVAGNFASFQECVREFQYFYGSKLHEILESKQPLKLIYANIFREIHTFKGSFSQFEMQSSVEKLNSMENALAYIGSMLDSFSCRDLCAFIYSFDIIDFLNKDLEILSEKLGSHFFSMGETIYIDKQKLYELEDEIINICSPVECRALLPLVKRLRHKSLKEMLSSYPEYTIKLAERLEKPINTFSITGDDLLIDSEKYSSFIKSLVHVFRNSVDHGLESLSSRLEQGKTEAGNISCCIGTKNNILEICIEDDGRGIDYEKIRSKAVTSDLYDKEKVALLDEQSLINLIFGDSFSTKDKITDVSGRGMGLYAAKSEVEKLGGKIELITEKFKGTKLKFVLPIVEYEKAENLTSEGFVQPILAITLDFLKEHLGPELNIESIIPFNSDGLDMMNYTAFIKIKGLFDGLFCISMDNEISHGLLCSMVYGDIQKQYENKYTKDVIAECANMILGNSINAYRNIEELIMIGTPNVMYSNSGDTRYDCSEINGYNIKTDMGQVVISIIN
jgi:two-component system, chemotaxis family, sensor kinase CheA